MQSFRKHFRIHRWLGFSLAIFYLSAPSITQATNAQDIVVYRDKAAGFIFQYPKTWSSVPATHERTRIKIVSNQGEGTEDCMVNVRTDEQFKSLKPRNIEYILADVNGYEKSLRGSLPDASVKESGKTFISNQEAIYFITGFTVKTVGLEIPMQMISVITLRKNKMYTVACRASSETFKQNESVFLSIFSGFLINQNQP